MSFLKWKIFSSFFSRLTLSHHHHSSFGDGKSHYTICWLFAKKLICKFTFFTLFSPSPREGCWRDNSKAIIILSFRAMNWVFLVCFVAEHSNIYSSCLLKERKFHFLHFNKFSYIFKEKMENSPSDQWFSFSHSLQKSSNKWRVIC